MASSEDVVSSAAVLEPEAAYQAFMDERHARIMDQIAEACSRSGRELCEVTAFAVSKTVGPREVVAAMRAGWDAFAENRPQELVRKLDAFAAAGVEAPRFDMIGNLQKNKINQVLGRVERIQSISSLELARAVSERAVRAGLVMPALLECNVSGEESKGGFSPDEVREQAEELAGLEGLAFEGLMTMAPAHDPETARATFSGARELECDLRSRVVFLFRFFPAE